MSVTNEIRDLRAWMVHQMTTDSMIPWEWIKQSKGTDLFMAEREQVEMLLRVVNGERFQLREWERLCGAPLDAKRFVTGDPGVFDKPGVALWDNAQVPLRAALEGILREPATAVPEIAGNALKILDGRVIRVMEISGGVPRDRMIAESIGSALIFALTLVLDPQRPYRRLLRQCALTQCGHFALGVPPKTRGMPANFYCIEDHRIAHHRQQSAERQAAYRAGISVDAMRRRKTRRRKA